MSGKIGADFNFDKLNRPATLDEYKDGDKTPPCIGHAQETELIEAKERLEEVKCKLATKFDQGKPSFTSIPQLALLEVAKGFTVGKEKYGQYNYSGKMEVTRYLDALNRHMSAYLRGESIDECGVHHLGLVACNALMALDGIFTGNTIENINPVYKKNEVN